MPKRVLLIHCCTWFIAKNPLHMWFLCEILLIRCLVCELKWLEWCWLAIWQIWVNVTTHPPSLPQATKGKTEKSKEDEDTITRLCAWMYACGNKSMVCWLCPGVCVCVGGCCVGVYVWSAVVHVPLLYEVNGWSSHVTSFNCSLWAALYSLLHTHTHNFSSFSWIFFSVFSILYFILKGI